MDFQKISSRSRSIDLPKPEAGLAEWTSKIKAMQREVDRDDELEQRKLEEEITASRLKRQSRMSRGASGGPGGVAISGLDLSQNPEYARALRDDTVSPTIAESQNDQETALRKLMGNRGITSSGRLVSEGAATSSQRPDSSISLAAFMGARGTGPRLNKHAPQQDAHDPTQFEQMSRVDKPHPVFGRGGVAMPGMTNKAPTPEAALPTYGRNMGSPSSPVVVAKPPVSESARSPALATYRTRAMSNSRAKSSLSPPADTPISKEPATPSSYLQEPATRIRDMSDRSPSPANSSYSRHKTPEPPSPVSPLIPRPMSRNNESRPTPASYSRQKTPEPPSPVSPLLSQPSSRGYEPLINHQASNPNLAIQLGSLRNPAAPSIGPKPEATSLASFMGGRATGPRLNRLSPQQDAHDPTQFEQRRNITSPHPVFGRSGVAMPGMAAQESAVAMFNGSERVREAANAWQVDNRERTLSAPATSTSISGSAYGSHDFGRSISPTASSSTSSKTPIGSSPSAAFPASPPRKSSPVTTSSLARSIEPAPHQSPIGPQMPASKTPSRAFLRPAAEKEPTPSLSRLKGRGFVQNMIKTSSQLELNVNEFGHSSTPEKLRVVTPRKSMSVLDRWQPGSSNTPSLDSPPISPKPIPLCKPHTMDPAMDAPETHFSLAPHVPVEVVVSFTKPLKTRASLPSMSQPETTNPPSRPSSRASKKSDTTVNMPPQDTPGLGSSSTLISYIKPTKTGDDLWSSTVTDGQTSLDGSGRGGKTSELPVSSGPPLKHPTKGRARKPRKDGNVKQVQFLEDSTMPAPARSPNTANTGKLIAPAVSSPRPITPPEPYQEVKLNELQSSTASQASIGRITDRWVDKPIIRMKPMPPTKQNSVSTPVAVKPDQSGLLGRRALPGLVSVTLPTPAEVTKPEDKPEKSPATPMSPGRHARIPSTGNRATVMDVAQSWNEGHTLDVTEVIIPTVQSEELPNLSQESSEKPSPSTNRPRQLTSPVGQAEKRRSSYEKYAAIVLPSLPEERTPAPSPAVTMSRGTVQVLHVDPPTLHSQEDDKKTNGLTPKPASTSGNAIMNAPLPLVDISKLAQMKFPKFSPDSNNLTISTEVMTITKQTVNTVAKDSQIFYDTELLVIIHRFKAKSSGLVSTKIWSWQGKKAQIGEKEQAKLQELSKRYGTTCCAVRQYEEPSELIETLGGKLVVRQGNRTHWSSENTAMHSVKSVNGSIFIEEHDLSVINLCSGFSYCLTILDTLYVWYGCGSRQAERYAALEYARGLAAKGSTVVELEENQSLEDEVFWMMLEDRGYASADYWKWRGDTLDQDPRVWRIDSIKAHDNVELIVLLSNEGSLHESIYLVDCIWELFVLVGTNARSKARDLKLALSIAEKLSDHVSPQRPFTPTTHILFLPSRVPVDLRHHLRGMEELTLNGGRIPDHMNLLSISEAAEHLHHDP